MGIYVYHSVRTREKALEKFACSRSTQNSVKYSRKVMKQAFLYVGAFYITWTFPTIVRLLEVCGLEPDKIPKILIVLSGFFIAFQGFLNAMVFFRPRFLKCSKENANLSAFRVIWIITMKASCFCCIKSDIGSDDKDNIEHRGRASVVSVNEHDVEATDDKV